MNKANPKVPDVTPEHFDHIYLPNSIRCIDDIMLTYYFHLCGGIENDTFLSNSCYEFIATQTLFWM